MYIECININKNINEYYQLYKTVNEKNSNINMLGASWYYKYIICCGVFITRAAQCYPLIHAKNVQYMQKMYT